MWITNRIQVVVTKFLILYYWLLMEEPNNKATIALWVLRRGLLPCLHKTWDAPLIHTHFENAKARKSFFIYKY